MNLIDVVVLGDLNIDLIIRVEGNLLEDSSIISRQAILSPGGVGANIASNLAYMGYRVRVLGAVGRDVFGTYILEELKKRGIDVAHIQLVDNILTGFMVVLVGQHGNKTIIGSRGANQYFKLDDETVKEVIQDTRHLHVSGYAALNVDGGETLLKLLVNAKKNGKSTSIDLEGIALYKREFIDKLKGIVDYVFLNRIEAEHLCTENEAVKCSIKILEKIKPKTLFLKMGDKGSKVISYSGNEIVVDDVEAYKPTKIIDTTGAGDAYNATVIAYLIKGESPLEAARKGSIAGAKACERISGFV